NEYRGCFANRGHDDRDRCRRFRAHAVFRRPARGSRGQGKRCVLDLIGVAAGGSRMPAASIANTYAATQMTSRDAEARLLFDGRRASRAGAAFAGASTIDALDAHDGHALTKGHAGVAALPALLAAIDGGAECGGAEFLTCLVLGYEIGTRAGIALHAST